MKPNNGLNATAKSVAVGQRSIKKMNAIDALKQFVEIALLPDDARRCTALLETKKGLRKILEDLCHGFESRLDPKWTKGKRTMPMTSACFVFKGPKDCGTEHKTMAEAYDTLSSDDSWLIVAQDGLSGIYRPEGRWDSEKMIKIEPRPSAYRR